MTANSSDALRARLENKFNKQKQNQLETTARETADFYQKQTSTKNNRPVSIELISDDTAALFDQLNEYVAQYNHNKEAQELIDNIRGAVNAELKESLSYIEEGYTSAFREMLSDNHASANQSTHSEALLQGHSGDTEQRDNGSWNPTAAAMIHSERDYQKSIKPTAKPKLTVLKQCFSETVSLFTESLACLLSCGVVRIYLFDENKSLHCCSSYPLRSTEADPMRATYTEIMIAKELHKAVCESCFAVNGTTAQYNLLSQRDLDQMEEELQTTGLNSIKSCLVFPILSHVGANRCLGMIHAANKTLAKKIIDFDERDELIMSNSSKLLGAILTRYPLHYFTLRVGEVFKKAVDPYFDPTQSDHLTSGVSDDIEEAVEVANRAVASPAHVMIFRAPINNIYQTRTQQSKNKKLGNLAATDPTLSSVEFNLQSINQLWENGMAENTEMHKQFRALHKQLEDKKILLRNILDGVAATRSLEGPVEIARYLQRLELLGRSENTELIATLVTETLLQEKGDAPTDKSSLERLTTSIPTTASSELYTNPSVDVDKLETSPNVEPLPANPFLSAAEKDALLKSNSYVNTTKASHLHFDGPDYIRTYTSDPVTKRNQVRFIEELSRQERKGETSGSNSARTPCGTTTLPPTTRKTAKGNADYALSRPFQLKKL
ncbi:hypothetical protein AGDE_07047 [Angomonas deanei]|nr:hypothetical protein AGDE_07047 [Angomonas deanei]|eukprot:EPY36171.1 hypothetical protein AGDE_07047 [Angomonas deanei]